MENRRIKYPIIGTEKSLKLLTIKDIKEFYNNHYCPNNCVITIISSLGFEKVKILVERYFGIWNGKTEIEKVNIDVNPKQGCFINNRKEISSSKVQIIFPIHQLSYREVKALRIFNQYFGEGGKFNYF